MMNNLSMHVFVLCWPGKEAAAHHIAKSIEPCVDYLTVIYKNDTGFIETGSGEWKKISSEWFYGRQFKHSLDLNRGHIMLHIQADARFDHWPSVIEKCKEAFDCFPNVGVWAPNVYHSVWTPDLTSIRRLRDDEILAVTMTDGIVWALSPPVINRLRMFDYDMNNFGWGICEAACAFAFTNNMLVLMDLSLKVEHPKGSGYCNVQALEQGKEFITQLSATERIQFDWVQITKSIREKRAKKSKNPLKRLWRVFGEVDRRPETLADWRMGWLIADSATTRGIDK